MSHTILLIDDDPNILSALARTPRKEPYGIMTAKSAEEAAGIIENQMVDLIVCDEEMPGMSGTEFLATIAHDDPDIVRIVLTGHASLPIALSAINEGKVYQFFTKPCNEIDLAITIRRALEQKDLMAKSRELLEVTKQQSAVIDKTKILRRLREIPHEEPTKTGDADQQPDDPRELLDQMDHEVCKGKELLRSIRRGGD